MATMESQGIAAENGANRSLEGKREYEEGTDESRSLTEAEQVRLANDTKVVPHFWQAKYEKEAGRNWDLFYKRNEDRFFKDRHWLIHEFKDVLVKSSSKAPDGGSVLFEVGCGVGNALFPLLSACPGLSAYACDFSPRAVDLVKKHPDYDPARITAFVSDITKDDVSQWVPSNSVHVVLMMFVLSALHPDKMEMAVQNIAKTVAPGGTILIRDYAVNDMAMLRFDPGHRLAERFYVRSDGTRAYFFTTEELVALMKKAGCHSIGCQYMHRRTVNMKEGVDVARVFVQGRFVKE